MLIFLSQIITIIDHILWTYFGIISILIIGIYFTIKFQFGQITKFNVICNIFITYCKKLNTNYIHHTHPIKTFFTSIGGCIGIGNIVAVCTAIKIGGPGALFWIWIAAFLGMIFKYSEVYLGILYRKQNIDGSFEGGPMFFLQHVFKTSLMPIIVALLLTIYSTEIYIFNTLTEIITTAFKIPKYITIFIIITSIVFVGKDGINRVGNICSLIIPFFLIIFITMCLIILFKNMHHIPQILNNIFLSAFLGHAPIGGFAGSSILLASSQGIARGCYTGDIGIGFASIIHAQTSTENPNKQALLSIFGVFLDTFVVCTMSILVILITNIWNLNIPSFYMVQIALSTQINHIKFFMPIFIILLGYSSMISFYCVGQKCIKFIFPTYGISIHLLYTITSFLIFSIIKPQLSLHIMSIAGVLLLIINSIGIIHLRKKIKFI